MKRSKFTDEQIGFVLRQVEEGTSISEVCRKTGFPDTFAVVYEPVSSLFPCYTGN